MEKATGLRVEISSWRWKPLCAVALAGVKIEANGKRVLDCENVRLDCGLSLERPYVTIRQIVLKQPFVRLEKDAGGKWIVPVFGSSKSREASGSPRSGSWKQLKFPRIKILAGRIKAVQQGITVLSIRDFCGAVSLRTIEGAEGPKIRMDLLKLHARAHVSGFDRADTLRRSLVNNPLSMSSRRGFF